MSSFWQKHGVSVIVLLAVMPTVWAYWHLQTLENRYDRLEDYPSPVSYDYYPSSRTVENSRLRPSAADQLRDAKEELQIFRQSLPAYWLVSGILVVAGVTIWRWTRFVGTYEPYRQAKPK